MEDIKSTFFNLKNTITKNSGDFVKNTKLNLDLANEEEKLKLIYIEIGKKVHEIYAYGGSLGEYFDEKYRQVVESQSNINSIKEKIEVLKGVKTCTGCGRQIDKKHIYCPHCGASMAGAETYKPEAPQDINKINEPEIIPPEIIAPEKPQEAKEEYKVCASCGEKNPPQGRFCLGCGRILN
ncbi:double zinc ribbon domain-containing protein [Anaeropeptidivorans aminofermentans]|uniref:double zinc ribbon domain-containing protein n=1 Tax=Anaeropeptidivorans aminofermentans TaxID=2934315 RepID=UPI002025276D|nr:zinc ribbon domain-containing protein [Anaeropeptidivorans aminofermentans]MBE6012748.1 hypothetical protein [Lachnospiraceae bacterium]